MFDTVRFLQNGFSVTFPRVPNIRRMANKFEDTLTTLAPDHYTQPHIIPVPDEFEPELPRIIFGSQHGFSQIIISQISMVLNVAYSPDWQLDIRKGRDYLHQRVSVLFSLLATLDDAKPFFSGLTTHARLVAEDSLGEQVILRYFAKRYASKAADQDVHDLQIKVTRVHEDQYFDNLTVQNVRVWKIDSQPSDVMRLPAASVIEHGLDIVGDYNDRYAFNENLGYFSSAVAASEIIDRGIDAVSEQIGELRGEKN